MNYALSLATAALLLAAFPHFDFSWLAPVALAPLLIAVARTHDWRRRLLLGYIAGAAYWFGACYWIQFVLDAHGGMGAWGSWGAFALFCLAKALHTAVFALGAGAVIRRAYAVPAIASLWTGIERTHGPLGFAWQCLGNAGVDMSVPMRLAPFVGVYGLSFVFAMMSAALAVVLLRRSRRELLWLAVLPLLYLLPPLPDARPGDRRAVLLQPNLSEETEWSTESVDALTARLSYLSLQAAMQPQQAPPDVLVWPEVPAPIYYYGDARFRDRATNLARLSRTYFLFGTVAYNRAGAPLNSAVLLAPDGAYRGRYDKMYLVPFGEFVPPLFGFVNKITKEAGNFAPGERLVTFRAGDHSMGAFICYESVFPHLVRRFALAGAEVFLNLSNDGYFGHSAAREQHLKIARMRAAENRRWILRCTNDGISAVIDPAGRVAGRLPPFREGTLAASYSCVRETTPYTRYGDWFAWGCAAAAVLLVACSLWLTGPPR